MISKSRRIFVIIICLLCPPAHLKATCSSQITVSVKVTSAARWTDFSLMIWYTQCAGEGAGKIIRKSQLIDLAPSITQICENKKSKQNAVSIM